MLLLLLHPCTVCNLTPLCYSCCGTLALFALTHPCTSFTLTLALFALWHPSVRSFQKWCFRVSTISQCKKCPYSLWAWTACKNDSLVPKPPLGTKKVLTTSEYEGMIACKDSVLVSPLSLSTKSVSTTSESKERKQHKESSPLSAKSWNEFD